MLIHRFRDQLRDLQAASSESSFVPCPMFPAFTGQQKAMVQEVYRLAAELTREQLQPNRRRLPEFSIN
jgi:hypothetical protein